MVRLCFTGLEHFFGTAEAAIFAAGAKFVIGSLFEKEGMEGRGSFDTASGIINIARCF